MTAEGFLQDIVESPDDDTPRLVYADWLDDHDQPERAEFIRVQCELARMVVFNERRRALLARQHLLIAEHGSAWLRAEWPKAANTEVNATTFQRGFVAELSLHGRGLGDAGLRALARTSRLRLVAGLDLRDNKINASGLRALAASPFVAGLTFLDLRENRFQRDSLYVLAASPHLERLRELVVGEPTAELRNWFLLRLREVAVH
jgi:uncharacterized protein (TIGR02996 family)